MLGARGPAADPGPELSPVRWAQCGSLQGPGGREVSMGASSPPLLFLFFLLFLFSFGFSRQDLWLCSPVTANL